MKKNKNNENDFFETFRYNYNNLEGFDSLIKLLVFLIIAIILLVFGRVTINKQRQEEQKKLPEVQERAQESAYKLLIKEIIQKEATIKVTINGSKSLLDSVKESDGEITGIYQVGTQATRFKIKEQSVYEIGIDEEVENNTLLNGINLNFIIPSMLESIIEDQEKAKQSKLTDATYTYEYTEDEIKYEIDLTTSSIFQ